MAQAGAFGQKLGQLLHLKDAPPSLMTRSLRSVELAVTETRDDNPVPGLSGSLALEDAFLVSLKLHDYPDCELWERGKCVMKTDVRAGTTYLYDLKRDPRYVIDKPFHSLFFYLAALGARRHMPSSPARGASASSPASSASAMTTRSFARSAPRSWKGCAGRPRPTSSSSIT